MITIQNKAECCGCTACFNICPKNAISMQPDEEGFLYPVVDQEKCVDCGLCEKICPVSSKKSHEEQTDAYIIRYNNQKIVEESTSGGAFTAISSYVFENGGIVYGAGYDADMKVICKKAACMEDLKEMRGSKFVQSSLNRTFQEIKTALRTEKLILFTGTPCQVSGLIHYLGKHYENLICMDFVCRGVPSPGLWKNYVDYMEGKYHSKMIGARFKHKTYGYHTTTMKIDFQNGTSYFGSGRVDPYMKAFVREMSSRPSCAECAFKGIERLSDITVFDCYEYTQITGYKDDDKGYTSVFVHTDKGRKVFESIKPMLIWQEQAVEKLVTKNGIMVCNSAKPHAKRNAFYEAAAEMSIDKAMQKIEPITKKDRLIEQAKSLLFKTGLIRLVRKLRKQQGVEINRGTQHGGKNEGN